MNISTAVKSLGLNPLNIQQVNRWPCPLCKESKTVNSVDLNPCNHRICTLCLDILYDNYEIKENLEALFECPFCQKNVTAITYN